MHGSQELKEMERATRTVMAFNVNLRADERDIFKFFSQVSNRHSRVSSSYVNTSVPPQICTVQDVKMIKDRSKRFKGFVYVELSSAEDVFKAMQVGCKAYKPNL